MISSLFRFHGHGSLRYVYTNGKAVRSQYATIKWVKNTRRSHSRISIVVSKKIIKKAVGRNRTRRRLYEFIRRQLPKIEGVYDIVVIVTSPELRTMPAQELEEYFTTLLQKAELLTTDLSVQN